MFAPSFLVSIAAAFAIQSAPPQDPPTAAEDPVALEDVIVEGSLKTLTRDFVDEVGAPAQRRGLARWRGGLCIGVANVGQEIAQPLVDHVSRMAMEQGLRPGDPGCRPNVMVMFTADAKGLATAAVEADRAAFHLGVGGLDRGNPALRAFQETDAPVRWWHVSMPTNAQTGARAIRMPGDESAPYVASDGRVNRGRWIRDDLRRVFVIVDIEKVSGLSLPQLGDYIGLVTLAQVDPVAETDRYETILNLFDDPDGYPGLTGWDRAYLRALYTGPSQRIRNSEQTYQLLRNLRKDAEPRDGDEG